MRAVLANLPEGVSEDDFVGILKLALLTECATESYANVISSIGNEFGATWLSRFTQRVWAPDEITHHTPYRLMLLDLGFSCEELDREIKDTQEKQYLHTGARTPVNITTFGMIQEYLTDSYHGLIAGMLRKSAPEAAHMVFRVKRRETLHAAWYRDMTAIQVESNPRFVEDIVRRNHDLRHARARRWCPSCRPRASAGSCSWASTSSRSFATSSASCTRSSAAPG